MIKVLTVVCIYDDKAPKLVMGTERLTMILEQMVKCFQQMIIGNLPSKTMLNVEKCMVVRVLTLYTVKKRQIDNISLSANKFNEERINEERKKQD